MKNKTFRNTVGGAIAVVAIALIGYYGFFAAPVKQEPAAGFAVTAQPIDETGPGYSITGSYPEISGGVNAGVFNGYMAAVIRDEEDNFKQGLNDANFPVPTAGGGVGTSTLAIHSTIVATSTNFIGILLSSENYLVGMAHPFSAMNTVNFDFATGNNIALGDLFAPGSDYLNVIADYSAKDLADQIKNGTYVSSQDYIAQSGGLIPDPTNFQVFSITPSALIIHFQEYQVGPYASGPATTVIPWSALSAVLSPVGPLSHLFGR